MVEVGGDGPDVSSQRVFAARDAVLHLVPSPWDRDVFLERLGKLRGRPIRLVPLSSPPVSQETDSSRTPCGFWVEGEEEDFIVYDARTTEFHVDQIVGHEAGHMLLDHAQGSTGLAGVAHLMPDIDPAAIRRVLGRTEFSDSQEDEAELFADLLLSGVSRWRHSRPMRSFWGDR